MSEEKRLLCVACAGLHPAGQFCPVHPDEPLLDPSVDEVRFELMNLDDRARSRTYMRWMVGLGGLGLLLAAAGYLTLRGMVGENAEVLWKEIIGGGTVLGGFAGFLIAMKRYRPRFREWTRDG